MRAYTHGLVFDGNGVQRVFDSEYLVREGSRTASSEGYT